MVQAQHSSEWTKLWYGTFVWFLCSEMTEPLASNVCKSDTSGSQLKVPFAVMVEE